MDITTIKELIERLKERPATPNNVRELAELYIVYDHMKSEMN